MKFIGQHIWDYISRFRNDVYLESIADGTVANDKFLGLDSNNKIVKEAISVGDANQTIQMGVSDSSPSNFTSIGFGTGNVNLTFEAGEGIDLSTSISPIAKITIAGEEASTSNKGIAEYSGDHFSVSSGKVNLADTITGDRTIQGDLRIGGSGDTSDNWISIDAQNGDDSSGGGITFYETGTYSTSAPQYGAKIVYNEDDDELAIGTIHNNTFMRQIHMDRGSEAVIMQNIRLDSDSSGGPFLYFLKTDTSVADGDSLCRILVRNSDRGTSTTTSQIQWFATENHDANSCGTKINFTVTPNGNSQSETTAMTIDQDSSVTINGDLTVSSGTSGDATLIIEADTDNNDESDSPRLWFKADGDITQGAIQHKDNSFDIISNVSSNGGIRFLTGTTNNTGTTDPETGATERMSINSAGKVTVAGALQPNTIELGHASDTTIARIAAGIVTIENELVVTTKNPVLASSGSTNQTIATYQSRRTLTTAEMNDLHNTPIQVAPSGGSNVVIRPIGGMIRVDRASTNSGGGSLDFHYNGVTPAYGSTSLVHYRRFHTSRTTDGVYNIVPNTGGVLTSTNLTGDVNKAIEVSLTSACTTNCFTSVDIFLTYQKITIA